jgi:hypothetical protein
MTGRKSKQFADYTPQERNEHNAWAARELRASADNADVTGSSSKATTDKWRASADMHERRIK